MVGLQNYSVPQCMPRNRIENGWGFFQRMEFNKRSKYNFAFED